MRVLVFGASGVQGFWDSQGGWVIRLRRHYDSLQIQNLTKDCPRLMNLGISGDTTEDLLARVDNETAARQNAKGLAVIYSVGTNNASIRNGQPVSTVDKYSEELIALADKVKKYTNKVMFVGLHPVDESKTMPVAWGDIVYSNEGIWKYEQTMRDVCMQHKLPHVATFEALKKQIDEGKTIHSADGLHLNDDGHKLVAELVQPVLEQLIAA